MSEATSATVGVELAAPAGFDPRFVRFVGGILLGLAITVCIQSFPAVAQDPPPAPPPAAPPPPSAVPPAAPPPPAAGQPQAGQRAADASNAEGEPTYWARDFSFDSVSVANVISRLAWFGVDIPVETEGTVSVDATIWIPFGALANPTAYRLQGTLTSPRLRVESVVLSNLEMDFRLDKGVLQITRATGTPVEPEDDRLAGRVEDDRLAGRVAAEGSAQLIPLGPLRVSLELQQMDLPYVLGRVDAADLEMSGQVSGQVQLENQLRTAATWPRWSGGGELRIDAFQWQDRPAVQIVAESFSIQQGRITSDQLVVNSPTLRVTGTGAVDTTGTGSYRLSVAGDSVPLEELIQWGVGGDPPEQTSGQLSVDLAVTGALTPFTWQAEGTLRGPQARLAGVELGALAHHLEVASDRFRLQLLGDAPEQVTQDARIQNVAARYQATAEAWRLSELEGRLLGGRVGGSAVWMRSDQGQHQADLKWSDLALDFQFDSPDGEATRLHADTSGSLQWSVAADQLNRPAAHQLTATAQLKGLAINGRSLGQLDASAEAQNASWRASAEGTLFDGDADLQLMAQVPADARWQDVVDLTARRADDAAAADADAAGEGSYRLQIDGAAIPLAEIIGEGAAGADTPLQLDLDVTGGLFPFDFQSEGVVRSGPVDAAGLVLGPLAHRFYVDRQQLRLEALPGTEQAVTIQSLQARYAFLPDAVRLSELSGRLWGGQLSGSAIWITGQQGRHEADLQWNDLALDFQFDAAASRPLRLHADTSGSVHWSVPADQLHRPAAHQLTASAQLQGVTLDGWPIGQLAASANAENARWQMSAQGTVLGGEADMQLRAEVPADAEWQDVVALTARARGQPSTADAAVPGEGSYRLQVEGATVPLDAILGGKDAGAAAASPLLLDLGVTGALFPLDFQAQGTVRSGPLELAGVSLGSLAHRFSISPQRLRLQMLPDAPPAVAIGALEAEYAIQPDAVHLNRLEGQLWDGQISGSLIWMTEIRGRHRAQLQWRDLNVRGRFPPTAEAPRPLRFRTSGQLVWSAAAASLEQPAAHRLEATAAIGTLTLDDAPLGNLRLTIAGQQTRWSATGQGDLIGRPVTLQADATVPATATWQELFSGDEADGAAPAEAAAGQQLDQATDGDARYALQFQTSSFPIGDAVAILGGQDASPDVHLTADVNLTVSGKLSPLTWQMRGRVRSAETLVAGLDLGPLAHRFSVGPQTLRLEPLPDAPPSRSVGTLLADYRSTADAWLVNRLQAQLWGGQVDGSGRWMTDDRGHHQAQLRWSDLTVQGRWSIIGNDPSRLLAATSGSLQWSAPAAALARPEAHQVEASLQVDELFIDETPIGALDAAVTADDGRWSFAGDGELLGGPATVQLQMTVPADVSWPDVADQITDGSLPITGGLQLGPMQADRLFALWQTPSNARQWSGSIQLSWQLADHDPASPRTSRLAITAEALQYAQQPLTDRLAAQLLMVGDQIIVQSLDGTYAGGRIGATGRWGLGPSASQLAIQLTAIDASRAVLPISPELGNTVAGRVSGRLILSGGDAVTLGGSVEMRGATLSGLPVEQVRSNVAASLSLPSMRWRIQMRDIHGRVARGRLRGTASLQSSPGGERFDLDSRWEMDGIDFEKLLDELGGSNRTLGRGVLTGTLSVSGRRIQSVRDLRGELRASLAGSDATAIPGLPAAQNFLGAFSLRNTRFDSGSIYGRISHGELQIRELWLVGDQLRVWGDGEVALTSGRLDVQLVAATGDFQQANPLLLSLAQQLALDAALPVNIVLRANELLSDRVIRLQLYGTYRRPQVRINPVRNLGENAARFFLRSIVGDLVPSGAAAAAATRNR